jgi:hypothetical protein
MWVSAMPPGFCGIRLAISRSSSAVGAGPIDHFHLGEGGDIHDPGALAHRAHFECHHVVHRPCGGRKWSSLRDAVPGEPARAFEAVDLLMHRALGLQRVVQRRGLDRPAGEPVEMRERDLVAQAVVFLRP